MARSRSEKRAVRNHNFIIKKSNKLVKRTKRIAEIGCLNSRRVTVNKTGGADVEFG